ncbi:hypothetical protein WH47_08375, partial [Habropoda laboriosa]
RFKFNLGGPGGRIRRLFVGVVGSMAQYGPPVWAGDPIARRCSREKLRRVKRHLAHQGYRTTSHAVAAALVRLIPFEF